MSTVCHWSDKISEDEMGCSRGTYGEKRNAKVVIFFKIKGNSLLGTLRNRWDNSFKMYLSPVGLMSMDKIILTQNRHCWRTVVNMEMNLLLT